MSRRLSLHVLWMPLLSLLFQSGEARAFEQPYKVPPEELWRSDIPRAAIRFADMNGGVCLMVVVDAQGAVESVKILDGPRPVLKKAAAAERQLHFKPFLRNGRPVRATFEQCVEVIPEERWGQRQPFPTVRNWKTVKISFERRHRCDEPRCLDYKMEISGDGIVRFTRTRWASLIQCNGQPTSAFRTFAVLSKSSSKRASFRCLTATCIRSPTEQAQLSLCRSMVNPKPFMNTPG